MNKTFTTTILMSISLFVIYLVAPTHSESQGQLSLESLSDRVSRLEARVERLEKDIGASYNSTGERSFSLEPGVGRGRGRAFHTVSDTVRLSSGSAVVTISSSPGFGGSADVSFRSGSSYSGVAFVTDTSLASQAQYSVVPIDGSTFKLVSTLAGDSALIRYILRGE